MLVKQAVYNELRRAFPKQVLGYEELPKGEDARVDIKVEYSKGEKSKKVNIISKGETGLEGVGKVKIQKRKGDKYLIHSVVPFYWVYEVNDKREFSKLNSRGSGKRGCGKVKAKRESLQDLTGQMLPHIMSSMEYAVKEIEKNESKN